MHSIEIKKIKCPECGKELLTGKWSSSNAQITYCAACGTIFVVIFRYDGSIEYVK